MLISQVKPDNKSIVNFFDNQHNFFTELKVTFIQNNQLLRAILWFPFHNKGRFLLEKIEIYHHNQWTQKKGDSYHFGMALAEHYTIVLLGKEITANERNAKNQLERRFRSIVTKLAANLKDELQPVYKTECEVSPDYLSITTKFEVNEEVIAGRIETNFYYPHTVDDKKYFEELLEKNIAANLENLERFHLVKSERIEEQKVYVTTIPILNPISEETYPNDFMDVSIHSEGRCQICDLPAVSSINSTVKINLKELERHIEDLLIMVVGDQFICKNCKRLVKKEKTIIKDVHSGQILAERYIDDLSVLGYMNKQEDMQRVLNAAVDHQVYFSEFETTFWNAFSFVASMKWDTYISELTRKELEMALRVYVSNIPSDATREKLMTVLKRLNLTVDEKQAFWRKANQLVVNHYLLVTVFGWDMKQEIAILGKNRAEFIFQYLPYPTGLESYKQRFDTYFSRDGSHEVIKLHNTIDHQQQQIRHLQHENGRLTQKLGQAYTRNSELEQTTVPLSNEVRNKSDILKIQQLKGLIEELKNEISLVTVPIEEEEQTAEMILTEEHIEQEPVTIERFFHGMKVLILGGNRGKRVKEENEYTIFTHDGRILDPAFYELLKTANIIIVLTHLISHRAMWEAKEFAILEAKPIYYSTFTNIPTILSEVANL